jgi:exopolysaccharide biosynthesis polyprenyl glycosylphosphotransferase
MTLVGGLVFLILTRWLWRKWLVRKRRAGLYSHRAVLLGDHFRSRDVAEQMSRTSASGIEIVGAIGVRGNGGRGNGAELVPGVPILNGHGDPLDEIERCGADTVVFTGADSYGPQELKELGWRVEAHGMEMILVPALTDIAGPRIHARPVAGLPLVHIDYPAFEPGRRAAKRTFDVLVSAIALALLSPILAVIALLVRLTSPGPALFKQERVGRNGERFKMYKFRSMVVDAEAALPSLLDKSEGNGVLFKIHDDPRVTRLGAVLRRYSIDELPQLINVLRNEMSLVGPRPPLACEVEHYDDRCARRLLVKPGITGLWQTGGRSNLSWEDSIRLDLYYVENWSMTGDLMIMFRTVKAVLRPEGAY